MFQIDSSSAVTTEPAPLADGTPGWFGNGTAVTPDWLNGVQDELINIITKASLTPAKAIQLLPALAVIFGTPPVWMFTSGNVTVPAWATRALVDGWGGGGAGGFSGTYAGAGGAGGGWGQTLFTGLTPSASIAVVAGAAGAAGAGAGGAGGSTEFNATVIATGGAGGGAGNSGSVGIASGSPGTGVGHATQAGLAGQLGQNGIGTTQGGMGGSAPFGGAPTVNPTGTGGLAGNSPGGGGSGSVGGAVAGNGAAGALKIVWLP